MAVGAESPRYRYADYRAWDGPERWELIEGEPCLMSPSPTSRHQELVGELLLQIGLHLRGRPCKVLPSPLDVRLPKDQEAEDDIATVVQPDLVVVCDPQKIDRAGVRGAPDLVIEVLSPSTALRDRQVKRQLYLECGVREYWIVDDEAREITLFRAGGWPVGRHLRSGDTLDSAVLLGFELDWSALFPV